MVPSERDTEGEAAKSDEEIEATAHEWMKAGRITKVDTNHNYKENGSVVVESSIARKGDPDFKPGTWFVRVEITEQATGEKIDKGELNAFSWAGPYDKRPFVALVKHPLEALGTTEKSDAGPYPEHDHDVTDLRFRDDSKVVPTVTGAAFGHVHQIKGTTRTEKADGHSHPLLIRAD